MVSYGRARCGTLAERDCDGQSVALSPVGSKGSKNEESRSAGGKSDGL